MRMRSSGCSCWYFVLVINHTLPNGKVLHFKFEAAGVTTSPNQKDFLNLTLALQARQAQGKLVLFSAVDCYGPDVRDGLPSVICKTEDGGDVDIASTDNVREILLGLRKDARRANIIGKAIGIYGSSRPMILVVDAKATREK